MNTELDTMLSDLFMLYCNIDDNMDIVSYESDDDDDVDMNIDDIDDDIIMIDYDIITMNDD